MVYADKGVFADDFRNGLQMEADYQKLQEIRERLSIAEPQLRQIVYDRLLVERVLPPCRPDSPPRGNHLAPGVHVDHGPDRRERAKANNPSHFHACRFDADPAGAGHGRAFFRWLGSTAEQLDEKTRWTLVVRCAFRRILLPDPALKPLYALK